MKQASSTFITISIICALASCTVQKRVYRNGWNIEWNKKLIANHAADEKKLHVDSLELDADISLRKETFYTETSELIPVKNTVHTIVDQQFIQLKETHWLPSVSFKQNEKIPSLKSKLSKSNEKKGNDRNMKRHYLIPVISLVVGVLIITMAIFLIVPMNQLLGILLFFLGLLLVLFSLLKIVMILISNRTKTS